MPYHQTYPEAGYLYGNVQAGWYQLLEGYQLLEVHVGCQTIRHWASLSASCSRAHAQRTTTTHDFDTYSDQDDVIGSICWSICFC